MTGKSYAKCQEWTSGDLYRLDKAIGRRSLEEASLKTNNDVTYINLGKTNGVTYTVDVTHGSKSFEKSSKVSAYAQVGTWKGVNAEERFVYVMLAALASNESLRQHGKDKKQKWLVDPVKLRRIVSGQDPVFKVHLDEKTVNGQQLHAFIFDLSGKGTATIECDKTNYHRITRTETKTHDGEITFISTRKKFDARDFPHEYFSTEKQKSGYITNKFLIKEVELDAQFSDDEVFRFAPPKNYVVTDDSDGTTRIVSLPEGVKKNIKVIASMTK